MKVFISWSGKKSELVANELRIWLSYIFQSIEFWMSKYNVPIGSRWYLVLSSTLEQIDFGIVILTKENFNSPWLQFEAGAISKTIERSKLIPFLVDIEESELSGPLSFFQAISFNKSNIFRLVKMLAESSKTNFRDDKRLEIVFEKWYPELEDKINEIKQLTSYPINKNAIRIFTTREITILHLLMEGKSKKEIYNELQISIGTIHRHIANLQSKLGASTIKELIELAKYYELI